VVNAFSSIQLSSIQFITNLSLTSNGKKLSLVNTFIGKLLKEFSQYIHFCVVGQGMCPLSLLINLILSNIFIYLFINGDDDDDIYIYIYIYFLINARNMVMITEME